MKSIYTTTTKYAAVALSLLLAACTTDLYHGDDDKPIVEPEEKGLNIPDDFDFSMVTKRTLTVNVMDEYEGTKDYMVEGYVDNPIFNPSAKLLFRRKTNEKSPCVIDNVTFANTVKILYIRQTDPYGIKTVYTFPLEGKGNGDIVCDLKPAEAPETKAAGQLRSEDFDSKFTVPKNVEKITKASDIKNNGVYLIPEGKKITIRKGDMPNGNGKDDDKPNGNGEDLEKITLYIAGTLEFKIDDDNDDFEFKNNCQIVVLESGKIIGNGVDLEFEGGSDLFNKGVIEGIDDLSMGENNKNNDCVIYNKGTITVNDLSVDGTRIYNYCLIDVKEEFEIEEKAAGCNLYLRGGAFLCGEFKISQGSAASGIYFEVPKTILKGNNAIFNVAPSINGPQGVGNDKAAFWFNNLSLNYKSAVYAYYGVDFACTSVTGRDKLIPMWGAAWSQNYDEDEKIIPSFGIEPTDCNGNTSSKPETKPEEPSGPATEEPGETETYTFLFEDNWPAFGDYDMNDIVLDLNVANQEIEGNNAKSAIITAKLRAVGATKNLYLFVRANNMVKKEIALFDGKEAHAALGNFNRSQMINTEKFDTEPAQDQVTVDLTRGTLSLGSLDVYIVWGDPNADKRNEIHLAGFSGTELANGSATSKDYRYKSDNDEGDKYNNMMWGLMVPNSFKYPTEMNSIMDVYPDFVKWAQAGGDSHEDWYSNASGSVYQGTNE